MNRKVIVVLLCFFLLSILAVNLFWIHRAEPVNSIGDKPSPVNDALANKPNPEKVSRIISDEAKILTKKNSYRKDFMPVDQVWGLEKPDQIFERSFRNTAGIEKGTLQKVNVNNDLINKLSEGDVFTLIVPGDNQAIIVTVSSVSSQNDIKTIIGSIEGAGIGYGVTLSQGGNILVGDVITERGSWAIDTVSNVTFITNGRKSHGLEHDVAP